MSYTKATDRVTNQLGTAIDMLADNPHWKTFVEDMREARTYFWRQAGLTGVTQKDQDKLLGAATFADQVIGLVENPPKQRHQPNQGTTP